MKPNRFCVAAGALALALLHTPGVRAAEPAGRAACGADARSLCQGVQPGGGRLLACLKDHQDRLSDGCKAALPTLERCAAEVQQLCANSSGPRARRACLRDNAAKLSPACRGAAAGR